MNKLEPWQVQTVLALNDRYVKLTEQRAQLQDAINRQLAAFALGFGLKPEAQYGLRDLGDDGLELVEVDNVPTAGTTSE